MFKRDSPLRSSLRKKYSFTVQPKLPEGACLEVFEKHWQQAYCIILKRDRQRQHILPTADEVTSVINHVNQMITLLLQETQLSNDCDISNKNASGDFPTTGPLLSFFLFERCLDKLLNWSSHAGELTDVLKVEQLKYYEVLVTNCQEDLLLHKPIVRPLLRLLASCGDCASFEVEKRLTILLNTLCVCITQFPILLQVFFTDNSEEGLLKNEKERFLIFSLLIRFIHREEAVGQQARDALLLCMALSRRDESIGVYIAEHSDFCPVLATGLSGLYSLLPRKFPVISEDWHRFTTEDIAELPELAMFLNSLEFCNAVIQVAHPMVQEQLMEYLYQGFLVPVLGPALHQNTVEEIITTTAYLELFLRTISEPILVQMFLKFILTSTCDSHRILDSLIDKLGAQGQLCLVTMSLFRTLLDLNCEDVLFELVLRYLIPCSHIMVSQRSRVRDLDIYCLSADKFLSLIPSPSVLESSLSTSNSDQCLSMPPKNYNSSFSNIRTVPVISRGGSLRLKRSQRSSSTSSFAFGEFEHLKSFTIPSSISMPLRNFESIPSSYMDYLQSAHKNVKMCTLACKSWSSKYDGQDPPPPSLPLHHGQCEIANWLKPEFSAKSKELQLVKAPENLKDSKSEVSLSQNATECEVKQKRNIQLCKDSSDALSRSLENQCNILTKLESFTDDKTWNILNQIVNTEDERTFWNLVYSTETDSSLDSLEDSLDATFDIFNDVEESCKCVNNHFTCEASDKDECSNTDSGVFESQQSDKDSDVPTCAKSKEKPVSISVPTSTQKSHLKGNSTPTSDTGSRSSNTPPSPGCWETFGTPNIGQFLGMLLTRLEMMMQNDFYTNLHLTGLISRLACYPQPLLHSFLLNPLLVFQPTVRSLLQVLGSLKHKLDSFSYTIDNFEGLVNKCRQFLIAREEHLIPASTDGYINPLYRLSNNLEMQRGEPRRNSLVNLFRRSGFIKNRDSRSSFSVSKNPSLDSILDVPSYRFVSHCPEISLEHEMESVKIKNAVLCSVVLEEFLKELAAIAQEHSVLQLNPDFWDESPWT